MYIPIKFVYVVVASVLGETVSYILTIIYHNEFKCGSMNFHKQNLGNAPFTGLQKHSLMFILREI